MVRVSDGRLMWQTPLARDLLLAYYGSSAPLTPEPVLHWLRRHVAEAALLAEPPRLSIEAGPKRLTFRLHQQIGGSEGGGDWLIIMQEVSDESVIEAMALCFKLTPKEAEVLYWVVKGKINRDIGDILGSSPMTVKKHLERVFAKLGVETRTAAAGMVMSRIRQLHPQFEG
jgi:DNA-binding CsgD family transcriptional regulator